MSSKELQISPGDRRITLAKVVFHVLDGLVFPCRASCPNSPFVPTTSHPQRIHFLILALLAAQRQAMLTMTTKRHQSCSWVRSALWLLSLNGLCECIVFALRTRTHFLRFSFPQSWPSDNIFTLDIMEEPVIATDGFTYEKRPVVSNLKPNAKSHDCLLAGASWSGSETREPAPLQGPCFSG
jgi:hypothetical protein